MGKVFDYDGPIVRIGNQLAALLWLNILTIIFCVPIITIGASVTSMHYVALKLCNNEEPKVGKSFLKAFKNNFRQATEIWLLFFPIGALLIYDFWAMYSDAFSVSKIFLILMICITIIFASTVIWTFILQSRYENRNYVTVRNALLMIVIHPRCSLINLVLTVIPIILFVFVPQILPLTTVFCFSLPGYLQARYYRKVFEKLEDKESDSNVDIASDEKLI